jgi:hypothetical protein
LPLSYLPHHQAAKSSPILVDVNKTDDQGSLANIDFAYQSIFRQAKYHRSIVAFGVGVLDATILRLFAGHGRALRGYNNGFYPDFAASRPFVVAVRGLMFLAIDDGPGG